MKRLLPILFLLLSIFAYPITPNPFLTVNKATSSPTIDGYSNDDCWQFAEWQYARNFIGEKAPFDTLAFAILYDDANLYIFAKIKEKEPKVSHLKDDDLVWQDSCLEIFIDNPTPNKSLYTYKHYVINAEGYRFDELASRGAESWNGKWEAKVKKTAYGWDAEIRIPAGDLSLYEFRRGMVFPFNICASLYYPSHILISFSPLKGGFHEPHYFTNLVLGETPTLKGNLNLSISDLDSVLKIEEVYLNDISDLENQPSLASLKPGLYALDLFQGTQFLARFPFQVSYFQKDVGATLHSDPELIVWTADPMHNIFQDQAPPQKKTDKIFIFAGRNEWEPFQIVFRPNQDISDFHLSLSDLKGPSTIPSNSFDIYKVEYVHITIPTDPDGTPGYYPDPLIKVNGSLFLQAGRNHPFWIELRIPSNAKPGIYKGEISAYTSGRKITSIPLELRVFNFSLPLKPSGFHLHTAYGMDVNLDYHKATSKDREKILPYYLRLLADHHISPYNPFAFPISYELSPSSILISNGKLKITLPEAGSTIGKLSLGDTPLCALNFCLDQREGEKIGWPFIDRVKPEILISGPLRTKIRVLGEKVSSSPANRSYEIKEEIEIFNGQNWLSRRLLSLKSTDPNEYTVASYFLLLSPLQSEVEPINGATWKTPKGLASCFSTANGYYGFAFRLDSAGGAHGDVTRALNLTLKNGMEAIQEAQQPLFVILAKDEKELEITKTKLSHPIEFSIEKKGEQVIIHLKETAGIKRENEPVVIPLGDIAKDWQSARAWQDKREIPSQLDGNELTLIVSIPANGEIQIKANKSNSPWQGKGLNIVKKPAEVKVDFSHFEPSARYALDELGFSDYNICAALDMGWLWRNETITQKEKELYAQLGKKVEEFLGKHNWLRKAYCYWYDEPEESAYPFVIKGMKLLKATFPNVRRLLTEQPEPPLYRYVDIWVPIFNLYDEERCKERQKNGQEVWWYVCCGPRHPYPNNFIDYPGIEHRIRLWMNWKYNVTGDLYWSTTYWHKNPWQTPMSYTPDDSGMWGNGDGYLLYPPERGEVKEKFIGGPVPSMRIKLIREGIEDAEYLWMLEEKIEKMKNPPREALEALNLARSLIPSRTNFSHSPEELQEVRFKVATSLEKLNR